MKVNSFIYLFIIFIFSVGCASTPEPQPQVKKDVAPDFSGVISSQNQQLANHSIGGFAYKSSKLDSDKWDRWAVKAAPIVKEILTKLPEEYTLQVTGHADASGPEEPEGNKPGNIKISSDRAKTVYNALKKANVDSPKITYKGMGSQELLQNYNPRAPEQRRVTFKIVPK